MNQMHKFSLILGSRTQVGTILGSQWDVSSWFYGVCPCRAPLHNECPKHHGHKGDPGVTPRTCGAVGKRAHVILMWARAPNVGNASHPRRLGGIMVRLSAMRSLWCVDFRMLKKIAIGGVS